MSRLTALLALLALPAAAAAQAPAVRALRAIDRADAGDTAIVVLHFDASPAVQVSEPFHLGDRVRLHVDLDQTSASPDSAALAPLAHGNVIAIAPHARLGGTALAIDVRSLGSYQVQQTDSTVTLRLATVPPAPHPVTAPPAAKHVRSEPLRNSRDAGGSPLLLLALLPGSVLLWLLRGRRTPPPTHPALERQPAATTSPAPDARVWAARALAGDGLGEGEVARRTGLAREALRLLDPDAPRPADSAARGSICRTPTAPETRR